MRFLRKNTFKRIAIISSAFLASGSIWALNTVPVAAAANQLYLSPASVTVQKDDSFSVSLRVNPGTAIDTVTASIGFDSSQLTLQGVDCSGSPLTAFPSCPTSGNPVSITSYIPGGSVTTDSFIARLTFKAVASSGTGTITLSGDVAAGGNSLGASASNSVVSFTAPAAPTCAPGQTGTYPNCVTPPSGSGSGGSTGSSSGGSSKPGSGGSSSTPTTPTTSPTGSGTATVSAKDLQFTQATFTTISKDPTQVYIQYGTDKNSLTQRTDLSELGTTHTITINPQSLVPGQTYYYVIVSKTQAGVITQTNVDSFTLNGLTVRIGVFGKNNKPLVGKLVTLHSTPMTATTDAKGYASFAGVIPGTHEVLYTSDGKTYTQQVTVDNNVTTAGAIQTAPVQTIAVVYNLAANKSLITSYRWVVLGLLLVAVVVAFVLFSQRKLRFAAPGGTPLSTAPIVVGGRSKPTQPSPISTGTGGPTASKAVETSRRLNSIPSPNKPMPGSTVTPGAQERRRF